MRRSDLDEAQQQPGVAAADRAATLRHYRLLRLLAENMRAGLEADRASEQGIATLDQCSNETKAGVEMLARCPPGWQLAQQNRALSRAVISDPSAPGGSRTSKKKRGPSAPSESIRE